MKPLAALGLALLVVGALVGVRPGTMRPIGGALALCGAALIVFSITRPRAKARAKRPYSWEEDERPDRGPEMYVPNPQDFVPRPRVTQEPVFTNPSPGSIPAQRGQVTTGPVEYSSPELEVPPPRQAEAPAAEFHATHGEVPEEAPRHREPPARAPSDPGLAEDTGLPPMAPPPPPPGTG